MIQSLGIQPSRYPGLKRKTLIENTYYGEAELNLSTDPGMPLRSI